MHLTSSLRFRVAFAFACLGAFFSLLLAGSLYFTIENLSHSLMDQTLQSELEDSIERHARNPNFIPPASATILGFIRMGTEPDPGIPDVIAELLPGKYNITLGDIDFRLLVADNGGYRYYMLFDTDLQHQREHEMVMYLIAASILLTLFSAAGGFWLAARIITPLTRLARQVSQAGADEVDLVLHKLERDDEVGELARSLDRYVRRLRSFIEREKLFTADVSHELRTPLAVISGAVEVLEQDPRLLESQKQKIARIKRAVQESKELGNALLLLAREQQGKNEEQSCLVADVLTACIEKHHHLMEGNPVALEVEIAANPRVDAERTLLEVVIGNLVRNAFSYTKSGTVQIRLEPNRLVVSDTGIGIRDDEMNRIFLPHYRGKASTGAGIGLSLVKRICDRFNWRITFTSRETQGTTAEVVFLGERN